MGQQQLLLIILGVIIVGIAIAVGLSLFSAQSVQSNHDAIINDLNNIAANAYQHYIRPASMGGGANSYDGTGAAGAAAYSIPTRMQTNENGTYTVKNTATACTITGKSSSVTGADVTATVDNQGHVGIKATGW
ncbi:MAG: hypothetical protein NTX44_12700 [Ignavibacteriales bacterium]|nr:hypothetical protein [Ignavibacteriales bacterium]